MDGVELIMHREQWTTAENRLSVRVIIDSARKTVPVVSLEKGQIWIMRDQSLEVKHVGKRLVEFKLIKRQESSGPPIRQMRVGTKLESIKTVLEFLKTHKAVLEQ